MAAVAFIFLLLIYAVTLLWKNIIEDREEPEDGEKY
jgi:hypothetical protein